MQRHLVGIACLLLSFWILHVEASGREFKVQDGACLTGEKTVMDTDIVGVRSEIECAMRCEQSACIRGSFDTELKVCRILYSMEPYVQIAKEACTAFITRFIERFQLIILWKMGIYTKGGNLGISGNIFNVLNENEGVSYIGNHAVFSGQAGTNLTAVGLKSVEIVDFTLSFWMIPDYIAPGVHSKCIIETWSPDQSPAMAFHVWQGDARKINVYALDEATGADWGTYPAEDLPQNQWSFVTYVHNTVTGNGTVYYNATELVNYLGRYTITGAAMTSRRIGDRLRIGTASPRRGDTVERNFKGSLKCVSLATRVLANYEIAELMNECK